PTTDLASRRSVTSKGSKISSAGASTKSKAPKACQGHRLAVSFDPRCDVRRAQEKARAQHRESKGRRPRTHLPHSELTLRLQLWRPAVTPAAFIWRSEGQSDCIIEPELADETRCGKWATETDRRNAGTRSKFGTRRPGETR